MATYAVQWEGIRLAHEAGCEEYDMFGAAPNNDPSHPSTDFTGLKAVLEAGCTIVWAAGITR